MKHIHFILISLTVLLGSCAEKKTVVKNIHFQVSPADWLSSGPVGSTANGFAFSIDIPELTNEAITNGQISLQQKYSPDITWIEWPFTYVQGPNVISYYYTATPGTPGNLFLQIAESDMDTQIPTEAYDFCLSIIVEE